MKFRETLGTFQLFLLAVILLGAGSVEAQRAGPRGEEPRLMHGANSVTVQVVDAGGGKIGEMVYVALFREAVHSASQPEAEGYCDPEGYYFFGGLEDGDYVVSVSVAGYLPRRYSVMARHGERQQVVARIQRARAAKQAAAARYTITVEELGVPEKARKNYERARELYGKQDYKSAVKKLHDALEADANYVSAHNALGLARWRMGSAAEARESFETALRINSKFLPAYLNLAELLLEQKDTQAALTMLKRAAESEPYRAEPYFLLAKIHLGTGDLGQAAESCKKALERDYSAVPEIHLLRANIGGRRNNPALVMTELETYLAMAPHGAYAGEVREKLGRIKAQQARASALLPGP